LTRADRIARQNRVPMGPVRVRCGLVGGGWGAVVGGWGAVTGGYGLDADDKSAIPALRRRCSTSRACAACRSRCWRA